MTPATRLVRCFAKRLTALCSLLFVLPIVLAADAPADPLERLAGKDVEVSLRIEVPAVDRLVVARSQRPD